jgi:hypothetical protein
MNGHRKKLTSGGDGSDGAGSPRARERRERRKREKREEDERATRQFKFGPVGATKSCHLLWCDWKPCVTRWMGHQLCHNGQRDSITPDPLERLRRTWHHVANPARTSSMIRASAHLRNKFSAEFIF